MQKCSCFPCRLKWSAALGRRSTGVSNSCPYCTKHGLVRSQAQDCPSASQGLSPLLHKRSWWSLCSSLSIWSVLLFYRDMEAQAYDWICRGQEELACFHQGWHHLVMEAWKGSSLLFPVTFGLKTFSTTLRRPTIFHINDLALPKFYLKM